MRTQVARTIRFKDGSAFMQGTSVIVSVDENTPSMAVIEDTSTGIMKRVQSIHLSRYFDDFIPVSMDDLEEAIMDCGCSSLTGESVEPDGWDRKGFPSILLAMSMI